MSEFRPRSFNILPLIIKNLLIINGLVFLAQYTMGEIGDHPQNHFLQDLFALHYWRSPLFKPHQLITHLFMHGSTGHLFSNMFTLWMFGSTLENLWGPKRFLTFYLICGLGAAFCHMGVLTYENMRLSHEINAYLSEPNFTNFHTLSSHYDLVKDLADGSQYQLNYPSTPTEIEVAKIFLQDFMIASRDGATLGASGAVFGLLFAFGYLFPNSLIYIYFLFPIKAKYIVGFMILLELVSGVQNTAGDNVAHFAHLGGVLFSYLLLRNWNRKNRRNFY